MKAEKLPPHRACDHHIELEGSLPPVEVIYSLSKKESDTLRAYISENLEKGFIRPSSSSTGAPVLFVKRKDGGLLLCVDYCTLNAVARKNKYPVPPMNQLLNVFNVSSIFSKIDFHGAYILLRIKEGDEHLTCFRTKHGSYEYLVIPFGLTNAAASFQNLVNDIFQDLLDVYAVFLLKASRWTKQTSSRFSIGCLQETSRLLNPSLALPISTAASSRIIQRRTVHSPVSSRKIHVFPSMRKLSVSDSGIHPIAFNGRKPIPEELNYEINDKELLCIFWALKRWRAFLLSLSSPFEVLTDHSSLQYFMTSKLLTRRQAHWAEFLSKFHFSITYRPGRLATLPDALSRWDDVYPERGGISSARIQ
ncbi:hypothetical protein O181_124547 [Austropuccinia psidii MF-1]|uniref:Reverse transcriptase RNase H-like domain-containing protein n=1 Tax=Austropuccinia psidii MF-1 TaxID=1389203 RepID=A0A9Q3KPU8_9BASI|nr:hypothetical protein [Austropuccinia psidii MF-1]